MTPEEKSLLERTLKMSEENNSILRGMRRSTRIGTGFKILYWIVILGITLGAYYYLQPYIESMVGIINQAQGIIQKANSTYDQAQTTLRTLTMPSK